MKTFVKSVARGIATIVIAPQLVSYALRGAIVGRDRALEGSMQLLANIPGVIGEYLRRAFLMRTIAHCSTTCVIGFGTLFSKVGARIDERVYVGPRCHLGLVHLEADVMLAAGVHIPSGPRTHGTEAGVPMRDQPGDRRLVTIGESSWIGSNAVVMADVGRNTIIGAGAVVTRPVCDDAVAAGVPARVVSRRGDDPQ
jgi:acetyltransferase-like isoleucine patch superfamily enzyme